MPKCNICENQNRVSRLGFNISQRYCGLCGKRLRWISSPNQYPVGDPESEAWVYPTGNTGSAQYEIAVQLNYAN